MQTDRSLHQALKNRENELQAIIDGAKSILGHTTFSDSARAIFDQCSRLIGATSGYVALLTDDGEENEVLFLEDGGAHCTVDPDLPMPIRGLRADAYHGNCAVYHNDFMNSEYVEMMPEGHMALKNVMFSPLVIDGKTVGIIGMSNKPADFDDRDAAMATVFGELAAIALQNSRYLEEIKRLKGIIPICSYCKEVRDDAGYWNRLEEYIESHSEAQFSHGICEKCLQERLASGGGGPMNKPQDPPPLTAAPARDPAWFKTLVDNCPNGIYALNDRQELIFVNANMGDILGYPEDEILGRNFQMFLTEESVAFVTEQYQKRQRGDEVPTTYEFCVRCKNGAEKLVEVSGGVFRDAADRPVTVGTMIDRSERRMAAERHRRYEQIISSSDDLMAYIDHNYHFKAVNRAFLRAWNKEENSEIAGHCVAELLGEEVFQTTVKDKLDRCLAGESVHFAGWLTYPGVGQRFMDVIYRPHHAQADQVVGVIVNSRDITEQELNRLALVQQKEKAQAYLDIAGVMLATLDLQGTITLMNKKGHELLGYPEGELLGKNWFDTCLPAANREEIAAVFQQQMSGDFAPLEFYENNVLTSAGEERLVAFHNTLLYEGDRLCGVLFSGEDITERKQAESAARDAAQNFRLLADHTYDWEYWLSPDGTYRYMSPACERITGYAPDELIAHPQRILDMVEPDYADQVERHYRDENTAANDYTHMVFSIRTKAGEQRWIEHHCTPVFDDQGVYAGRRGNNRDITDRKKLEQQQDKLLAALHQTEENIVITDSEGRIEYVNPAFEALTGYSAQEAIGQNPRILQSGEQDSVFYRQLWDRLTRGQSWQGHFVNLKKDGSRYTEAASISPVIDPQGRTTHYVAVKKNVSAQLEQEQQLRQKSKMEAVGVMAGGMAHNFNNNLSIILGHLELMTRTHDPHADTNPWLENMRIAALRSRDMIKNLMLFSQQGKATQTPCKLTTLIAETQQLLRPTLPSSIAIELDQDATDDSVMADPSQLQECLINLCTNAMHAMDESGTITISLETEELSRHDIPLQYEDAQPGRYARLSVTDSGCGMSPETVERIFDPFYTTKPVDKGSGLGLSTVQGIIKEHGGLIKVDSREGLGTTFALYLPLIEPAETSAEDVTRPDLPGGNELILLVDDDPLLAKLGEQMLTRQGYTVSIMDDSLEALKLFRANAERIDLVITDQTMPNLTGVELVQELKKIKPEIPTILCTGYSSKVDKDSAAEQGISAFLLKPLELAQLLQTVRQVLDGEA